MNIMSTVQDAVASMGNLQNAMNMNIDTSSIATMRSEIDAAMSSIDELQLSMQDTVSPTVSANIQPQIDVPETIQVPVQPIVTEQPQIDVDNVEVPVVPIVTEQPQIDMVDEITIPVNAVMESQPQVEIPDVEIPVNAIVSEQPILEVPDEITVPVHPLVEQVEMTAPDGVTVPVTAVVEQPTIETPESIEIPINPIIQETPQIDVPNEIDIPVTPVVSDVPQIDVPETIQVPVQPIVTEQPQIDVQLHSEHIEQVQNLLQRVFSIQQDINQQSASVSVLPDDVRNKIQAVNNSIEQMNNAMNVIRDNPFDLPTEAVQQEIIALTNRLREALQEQLQINDALSHMDIEIENPPPVTVPVSYEQPEPVSVPVHWQTDNLEVFSSTGLERFQSEIESTNTMLGNLNDMQMEIANNAGNMNILPSDAISDIRNLQSRIQELQISIEQAEQTSLDIGSDEANAQLEHLRVQLSQIFGLQNNLNNAMQGMDIENINQAYLQLSHNISNIERNVRDNFSSPVEIPFTWNTDNLEVFTGSGVERFQQEVASVNVMLEQLGDTQNSIAQQAYNTNLLPPEAFQDLNRLAVRIDMVRDQIKQIENNPLNVGTDTANAELEQLRSQLSLAVQEQNELNQAMQNMDVSAANDAYLRLSQTIGNTETYIRDNIDEQGRFNQEINEGISQADELMDTIKGVVSAYVSIQAVGDVLNISDELVQTTSRLNMMNDGLQTTDELVNMVYAAAQDARGSFFEMTDIVARFGNNARDAFSSSAEVVAFADLVQKQMTIAGASTTEASNAMLQLSQGLGSGVLRGDELNSIFEQAPNLIQNIADYLEVPIGTIREMASEGELTADIVKSAIFSASDEINARFEEMPMTWGQIWQSMQNTALIAFQPVLQHLNDIANSEAFQGFVNGAIEALATLANITLGVFDFMASCGQFVADNWSIISPVIYGIIAALAVYGAYLAITKGIELASAVATGILNVAQFIHATAVAASTGATIAATAAQLGYNSAMYACPVLWIIMLVIALISVIMMLCNWIAQATGAANSGIGIVVGSLSVAVAVVLNLFVALINMVIDVFVVLWNFIAAFANFFANVFVDPVGAIARLFFDLVDSILGLLQSLAGAIDAIFGSNLSGAVQGWRDDLGGWVDETFGQGQEIMATVSSEDWHVDRFEYGEAWDAGVELGDGLSSAIEDFSISDVFGSVDIPNPQDYTTQFAGMGDSLDSISGDTSGISDAMDITQEDLKYMRDLAEQEAVNRYTTAEITIEQTNHNTVSGGMDLDGIVSGLTDAVDEAVEIVIGKGD